MRRLILSSLKAHKGRLALTLVAITLSVSFVTASFVLADSLRSVFDDVSTEIYSEVDAEVRSGVGEFDRIESGERFDQDAIAGLADIEGVEQIVPSLGAEFTVFSIDDSGETLRPQGPPVLTFSVEGEPTNPAALSSASPFNLITGAPPGPGQVMLDTAQAEVLGRFRSRHPLVQRPSHCRALSSLAKQSRVCHRTSCCLNCPPCSDCWTHRV